MRSLAVWLIAILALPPLVIGAASVLGLPPQGKWLLWLTLAEGGIAVFLPFRQMRTGPLERLEERAVDRYLNVNVLALGLAVDSAVFFFVAQSRESALLVSGLAVLWAAIWVPRFARRLRIRTSVVIDRDPATVFGFVSDFRHATQWMPGIESIEKITPGAIGAGTQFLIRQPTPNGVLELVDEIVDYEWASRLTDRVANGRRSNLETLTFESVQRATRLSHMFESEVSYGSAVTGRALARWTMTAPMRRMRQAAWARLKEVLETQTTA
jgi:hypothetical protein